MNYCRVRAGRAAVAAMMLLAVGATIRETFRHARNVREQRTKEPVPTLQSRPAFAPRPPWPASEGRRLWLAAYNCSRHVSIRGLAAAAAHIMPKRIRADSDGFDAREYEAMRNGSVVFVVTSALGKFAKLVAAKNVRVVLITGAGVIGVPSEISSKHHLDWRSFVRRHVIAWFAQNYDLEVPHPVVHALPLGIDFHTLSEARGRHSWGRPVNECTQDRELAELAATAPAQRDPRIFVPQMARVHRYGNDREKAYRALNRNAAYLDFQRTHMVRDALWKRMRQYRFVLSPLGMGMDCHRTWEALALGCIPVLHHSTLTVALFQGIPAIFVSGWHDVNASAFAAWTRTMQHVRPEHTQVLARKEHWLRTIQGHLAASSRAHVLP